MNNVPNIEIFRKNFTPEMCKIKYYEELEFVFLFEKLKGINRRKSIEFENINPNSYCIGYFQNEKLVRIDDVNSYIPKETYLFWENNELLEAHEFYLGYKKGEKVSDIFDLNSSWYYLYKSKRIDKIIWIDFEDRIYYSHGKMTITYDYKYDEKGLLLIEKTLLGTGPYWKEPEKCITYDREKKSR